MSQTFQFNLPGITCVNCVSPIENELENCKNEKDLRKKVTIIGYSSDILEKQIEIEVEDDNTKSRDQIAAILKDLIEGVGVDCIEITKTNLDEDKCNDQIIDNEKNTIKSLNNSYNERQSIIIDHDDIHKKRSLNEITNKNKTKDQIANNIKDSNKLSQATNNKQQETNIRSHLIQGSIGVITGFGLMLSMLGGFMLPAFLMSLMMIGSSALTLYLGKDSYQEAYKKFTKSRTLTMDTLFTVSSLIVVTSSIASFFVPWLPMMMDAGLMIFGFRHLGKAIEESIKQKVTKGLSFKSELPKVVDIKKDNNWIETSINNIKEQDIIRVKSGEIIPVNGIANHNTFLDKTILHGNDLQGDTKENEEILAGMKVPEKTDFVELTATSTIYHSYLSKLDSDIKNAQREKAPIENSTNKILQYFVPAILGASLISGLLVGVLINPILGIQCAASLLVSACPCTLGFITPLAVRIGYKKALDHGVLYKNSKALEEAEGCKIVVFDLHGTLNTGIYQVKSTYIKEPKKINETDFLQKLATLEKESEHPLAKKIAQYANEKNIPLVPVINADKSNHKGISGNINGVKYFAGNATFMKEQGIKLPTDINENMPHQTVFLATQEGILGYMTLKAPLRAGAKFVVEKLSETKQVYLLTGDNKNTALAFAKKLKIPEDHVIADCVGNATDPTIKSKVDVIKALQAGGKKVAMIGDAGNDACALTQSDFGIAVKSNASHQITQNNAKAIVSNASLLPILTTFAVSRETVQSIEKNLKLSLAYNTLSMVLSGGGLALLGFTVNPAVGVTLMIAQMSLILLNQYRVKQQALPYLESYKADIDNATKKLSSHQFLQEKGLKQSVNNQMKPQIANTYDKFLNVKNAECHTQLFPKSFKTLLSSHAYGCYAFCHPSKNIMSGIRKHLTFLYAPDNGHAKSSQESATKSHSIS